MKLRHLSPLLLLAGTAAAQQTQTPVVQQTTTVIADEPLPLNPGGAADRSVRSFDMADPVTQPLFHSAVDYLRLDPSVTLEERSPGGVQADISIRGTTFEQTLILVDGLRLNDPETGHLNLDLALPLEAVQSIEVLHGSGSTFYGSDAVGGAINLVTAAPTRTAAELRLGGGNMGMTEQHLQLSLLRPGIATRLTGSRDTSDGFSYAGEDDRGYHANQLALDSFLGAGKRLQPTEILLGASDRPYGANLFYGPYDSSERTKGWLAAIRQPLPFDLQADFAYRKHTDEYILLVGQPAVYENNHVDSLWQADLRGAAAPAAHLQLAYGLEADGASIRSNSLGRHAQNQGAGYVQAAYLWKRLSLSAGAREEIDRGPDSVFTPTASAGYDLGHGLRAHAAAGRGFRLPTYVDLYYSDPTTIGNPNLKPETSASYEGGLDWQAGSRWKLAGTGYTLRQTNAIDYSKYLPSDPYQARNVGRISYSGLEASATCRISARQQLSLAETFVHAPAAPANLISEYAYNFASHNASFAYQGVFPRLQLAGRTQVSVVQQVGRTAYPLWSVALTRSQGAVRPYVRTEDLGNVRYQELPGVPLPGRSVVGGVTLSWPRS